MSIAFTDLVGDRTHQTAPQASRTLSLAARRRMRA